MKILQNIHDVNKNFAYDINKISNNSPDIHQNIHKEIIDIYDNSTSQIAVIDSKKYFVTVLLNNKSMIFEVDSGAGYTLIPEDAFQKLNLNTLLKPTRQYFRAYTNDVFLPKGKATIEVTYKNRRSFEEIYVVPEGRAAILGRIWIRHLEINLEDIDTEMEAKMKNSGPELIHSIEDIFTQYSKVFE